MSLSRLIHSSRRLPLLRFFLRSSSSSSPPPSDPNINAAIKSLFKETDHDQLVARFKELSSSSHHFRCKGEIYTAIVRRLAAARRFDAVADILEAQKLTPGITFEGFAVRLISLYGKAGMSDDVYDSFRQLPSLGCPHSVLSFNALLSALSDAGEYDKAIEAFESIPLENPEIVPDLFSYNTVIHALCAKKEVELAMGFLELMEEKGMEPNIVTFTTLLSGFYRNGRLDDAEKVWAKMLENKCPPDVKCFNVKLRGLTSAGMTLEAAELMDEMKNLGLEPDGFSFTALIVGHCKVGNLEGAKKVLGEMRKRGCRPNRGTFEALVPRLCEAGDLDLALKLCRDGIVRKCSVAAEVLQETAGRLANESRLMDAKKLVEMAWSAGYSKDNLMMPTACLAA